MTTHGWNHWNPPRLLYCTCGFAGKFPTLAAANAARTAHLADGCEGCDHAIVIEIDYPNPKA